MSTALGSARSRAGTNARPPAPGWRIPVAGSRPPLAAASRSFAAQPLHVAHARRFAAGVLTGLPRADDVVLCVSELASNAVLHSNSREPGGQFTIRVGVSGTGRIRAEVEDRGGPWAPDPDCGEERGRGLLIVATVAARWGITSANDARTAWVELDPPDEP